MSAPAAARPLDAIISAPAVTIPETASLAEAAEKMLARGLGSLLCVDGAGLLTGIITDGDFVSRSVGVPFSTFRAPKLLGRWLGEDAVERIYAEARRRAVSEIMSSPVHTVEEGASVEDVLDVMLRRDVKHVPVVRDGRPVGVVSRHDLLKFVMDCLKD